MNDFTDDQTSLQSLSEIIKQMQSSISNLSLTLEKQLTSKPTPPPQEEVTRSMTSSSGESITRSNGPVTCPCEDRQYLSLWKDIGGPDLCFFPGGGIHPVYFIKKLTRLFEDAGVPSSARVSLAIGCLEGSAADWASFKEDSFRTFDRFVSEFGKRYWGPKEQRDLVRKIKNGRYESGSKADYLLHLAHLSTYLTEKMDEKELVEALTDHFTDEPDVRKGIVLSGFDKVEDVEEFLRKLDGTSPTQGVTEKSDEKSGVSSSTGTCTTSTNGITVGNNGAFFTTNATTTDTNPDQFFCRRGGLFPQKRRE